MEIVRTKDSGTIQYDIPALACLPDRLRASFFNADESDAIVFERYRDADAALEHFANISHLMAPLMESTTITGEVLGTPMRRCGRTWPATSLSCSRRG